MKSMAVVKEELVEEINIRWKNGMLAQNNNIRNYEFNLLEDILHNDGIVSYFEDANGRE